MKQKIFFVHSAGPQGRHEGSSDLVAWLKKELGSGYDVIHPKMPHPKTPDYGPWKTKLKKELAKLKGEMMFVGHSLGGSVLLKHLAEEPFATPISGIFLVAAPFWGGDKNWKYEPFILPKDFAKRIPRIPKLFLYHSKNDPIVPFAHQALYAEQLPDATIRRLNGDVHDFSQGLPELAADIRTLKG